MANIRERFSMDNNWKFHLGDITVPRGVNHDHVYQIAKAGGVSGPGGYKWDDSQWDEVNVPHDWAIEQEFSSNEIANLGYKPTGYGWYRKSFLLNEEDKGKHILLEFDGISNKATVYFNGSVAERNWSGYNSFAIDVSDRAFFGDKPNVLSIRVDANEWEGWWYEGAGIYRHTWLTKKSPLHIAHWGIWVNPKKLDNDKWNTDIETTIENSLYEDIEFKIVSKIYDNNGEYIGEASTEGICPAGNKTAVNQVITINNPNLWDIDSPNLYKVVSELYQNGDLVDSDKTNYGYRTIRICKDTGFYLNDKNVKLKGTCNHQDHGGLGVALPDSIHEYRIRRLKEMGSNAYRCAHNNPAKEVLDTCDKLGILVMDENRNFETSKEVLEQVESMVKRDRNHPCVIMYSIFNEEPHQGTLQGRNMAKRLMHTIKSLDNTRPVLGALNGGVMEDDGTATVFDVTGVNYQFWIIDEFRDKYQNQPMLGSENVSAFSTRGVYETSKEKQEFDCYDEHCAGWGETVRNSWKTINTRDHIMGMFTWTGFDYLGEPTPYKWPSVSTFFGAMDTCGFAKDSYYMHQACWFDKPMVHVLPHWNWYGKEGQEIKVMSHTNCEEVELFLNGISLGRKECDLYEQVTWNVPYEAGILVLKAYNNGVEVAEDVVETAGEAKALKIECERKFIYGDGVDAIPVNISAVDSEGRFVPIANNKVTFKIDGLGKLIGTANGNPNSHESFKGNERSLFNGRCQGILQSLEGTGVVKIIVEAEGIEAAVVNLEVRQKNAPKQIATINDSYLVSWRMTLDVFSERPNPNMEIQDSDMNTWEPLIVGNGPQNKFRDKAGQYIVYRTNVNIPSNKKNHILKFNRVMGDVEVYMNKELVAKKDCANGDSILIDVPTHLVGNMELSILIQNNNKDGYAGICESVILREV